MEPRNTSPSSGDPPFAARFWIVFCTFWNVAGWALSTAGLLNFSGYAVTGLLFVAGTLIWWRKAKKRSVVSTRLKNRFRRGFPLAFLAVAILAIAGGVLYPPSNPDGLTQRIPRLLNWLAAGQWHWIQNAPASFNTRATGFEWTMAPLIALTGTDRFVFLLNAFAFCLMPGQVFSVFHRLGVRKRVAWFWMWIVPTGYCFILQAGSIGNDMAGAVLALAAFDFALRARQSTRARDAWFAILAAALMTNAKLSNLTLLLPWGVAMLPSLKGLARRPVATALVCGTGLLVSIVPVTWFNIRLLGDWSGTGTEAPLFANLTPGVAFAGNTLNLTAQNLAPPFFPLAGMWNDRFHKLLPSTLVQKLETCFEPGGAHVQLMEMQLEVAAGIGLGVTALLLISLAWGWGLRNAAPSVRPDLLARSIRMLVWVSLLAYMVKTGLSTSARIIAPYYALLMPLLLAAPAQSAVVRQRVWRFLACAVFLVAALVLSMNPPRPLWPARAFFVALSERYPTSATLRKAALLYSTYAQRWDALALIRNHLPPDAREAGLIHFCAASSIETSLWRPFGARRIWWLRPDSPRAEMNQKKIQYIFVGTDGPDATRGGVRFGDWFEEWLRTKNGSVEAAEQVQMLATGAPSTWYLVRLRQTP